MNKKKINLGCGWKKLNGFMNCDKSKQVKPDKIMDLDKDFPFKDSSIDEIQAMWVIEHLKDRIHFLEECYRVLKPGGKIVFGTQHSSNHVFNGTLDHKQSGMNAYSLVDYQEGANRKYYSEMVWNVKINYEWFNFPGKRLVEWFCNNHHFFAEYFLGQVLNLNCIIFELTAIK